MAILRNRNSEKMFWPKWGPSPWSWAANVLLVFLDPLSNNLVKELNCLSAVLGSAIFWQYYCRLLHKAIKCQVAQVILWILQKVLNFPNKKLNFPKKIQFSNFFWITQKFPPKLMKFPPVQKFPPSRAHGLAGFWQWAWHFQSEISFFPDTSKGNSQGALCSDYKLAFLKGGPF